MQLYNITENLRQLNEMIAEGVDPEQLVDAFGDLEEAFEDKAKSILFVLQNMSADIDQIKAEETRLKAKRITIERQLAGLKEYLTINMQEFGIPKIENGVLKASIVKPKPVIVVINDQVISSTYKTETTSINIDKRALLSDLKNGVIVAGAEIGESKAGLKLK